MSIPDLLPLSGVPAGCGEGPTVFQRFVPPLGLVRAVVVFVDFSDAPGAEPPMNAAEQRLGPRDGQGRWAVERFYEEQSFGSLQLRVEVRSDLNWRRMPFPSPSYGDPAAGNHFTSHAQHQRYIADAASLFSPAEVRFGDFDMVFIVAPATAVFPFSPAFPAAVGQGASAPGGEIRAAVTFGRDSATNSFINLVHEVGHLFGLPDLYPPGGLAEESSAGCWSVMSDIFRATEFLGWHRHKNGWLDPARTRYVDSTTSQRFTLSALAAGSGTAMVVFPVDDAAAPSRVFVLEVAPRSVSRSGRVAEEGVLLYLVDANVDTDDGARDPALPPLRVLPRVDSRDDDGGNLFEAVYRLNDVSAVHREGGASISLAVVGKNGSSYEVDVDYRRS